MDYKIKAGKDLRFCEFAISEIEYDVDSGRTVIISKNADGYYEVFVQETADGTRTLCHGASKESVEKAILNAELIDLYK